MSREQSTAYTGLLKKTRSAREAMNVLKGIERDGFFPDVFHYNTTISKCAKDGELEQAKKLFRLMQQKKVLPTEVTFKSKRMERLSGS